MTFNKLKAIVCKRSSAAVEHTDPQEQQEAWDAFLDWVAEKEAPKAIRDALRSGNGLMRIGFCPRQRLIERLNRMYPW